MLLTNCFGKVENNECCEHHFSVQKFNFQEFQSLQDKLDCNAYDLIRASWQTRCDKLEQCDKMIAYNLSEIFNLEIERQKLSDLIKESAERIKERQDTDTIELVDDVRYYLTKSMPSMRNRII